MGTLKGFRFFDKDGQISTDEFFAKYLVPVFGESKAPEVFHNIKYSAYALIVDADAQNVANKTTKVRNKLSYTLGKKKILFNCKFSDSFCNLVVVESKKNSVK